MPKFASIKGSAGGATEILAEKLREEGFEAEVEVDALGDPQVLVRKPRLVRMTAFADRVNDVVRVWVSEAPSVRATTVQADGMAYRVDGQEAQEVEVDPEGAVYYSESNSTMKHEP